MKRALAAVVLLGAVVAGLSADTYTRVITRPKIPSQEVMDRLALEFNWHARVELDGPRDSIYSIQVIPRGVGDAIKTEVLVQTVAGAVHLFDGETGALRWFTPVGIRYSPMLPAAYNAQSIIVVRRGTFYVLHRDSGAQRVYTKVKGTREYGVQLDAMPSAAPAASDALVAFAFPTQVQTYLLPDFDNLSVVREKDPEIVAQEKTGSVQPLHYWTYYDPTMRLSSPPVITPSQIAIAAPDGRVISLAPAEAKYRLRFEFRTGGGLSLPPGDDGDFCYVGGQDFNLYAFNMETGRLNWRFASGAVIQRRPDVNDADVFIISQGRGLFRVHRFTGDSYWLEPSGDRFLAAHYYKDPQDKFKVDRQGRVLAKYVYAADRQGKLLILDGERGGILAHFDTSAWQTPVENQWTDRLYLGNLDGQILCLRPRDSRRPQVNKSVPVPRKPGDEKPTPAPPSPAPPSPKKEDERKIEDKAASNGWRPPQEAQCREGPRPSISLDRDDRIMTASL
jgi:outer membrane protein assembly factor BamB